MFDESDPDDAGGWAISNGAGFIGGGGASGPGGEVPADSRSPWGDSAPLPPRSSSAIQCPPGSQYLEQVGWNAQGSPVGGCWPPPCPLPAGVTYPAGTQCVGSVPAGWQYQQSTVPTTPTDATGVTQGGAAQGPPMGGGYACPPGTQYMEQIGWNAQGSPVGGCYPPPCPRPAGVIYPPSMEGLCAPEPPAGWSRYSDPMPTGPAPGGPGGGGGWFDEQREWIGKKPGQPIGSSKYPLSPPPRSDWPGAPDYLYITIANPEPCRRNEPAFTPEAPVGYSYTGVYAVARTRGLCGVGNADPVPTSFTFQYALPQDARPNQSDDGPDGSKIERPPPLPGGGPGGGGGGDSTTPSLKCPMRFVQGRPKEPFPGRPDWAIANTARREDATWASWFLSNPSAIMLPEIPAEVAATLIGGSLYALADEDQAWAVGMLRAYFSSKNRYPGRIWWSVATELPGIVAWYRERKRRNPYSMWVNLDALMRSFASGISGIVRTRNSLQDAVDRLIRTAIDCAWTHYAATKQDEFWARFTTPLKDPTSPPRLSYVLGDCAVGLEVRVTVRRIPGQWEARVPSVEMDFTVFPLVVDVYNFNTIARESPDDIAVGFEVARLTWRDLANFSSRGVARTYVTWGVGDGRGFTTGRNRVIRGFDSERVIVPTPGTTYHMAEGKRFDLPYSFGNNALYLEDAEILARGQHIDVSQYD